MSRSHSYNTFEKLLVFTTFRNFLFLLGSELNTAIGPICSSENQEHVISLSENAIFFSFWCTVLFHKHLYFVGGGSGANIMFLERSSSRGQRVGAERAPGNTRSLCYPLRIPLPMGQGLLYDVEAWEESGFSLPVKRTA